MRTARNKSIIHFIQVSLILYKLRPNYSSVSLKTKKNFVYKQLRKREVNEFQKSL